jgi:SAM-dependent methyltransferase
LALFKAEVLNDLVRRLGINSVIEFGCGDGAQLELAEYPAYIGIDVSRTVLEKVREQFGGRPAFSFFHTSEAQGLRAELSLSLDVIYHLIEDEVFEDYMRNLFHASTRMVVIYSSNEVARTDVPHVRHRRFTDWVEKNCPSFELISTIPNRYPFDPTNPDQTSFADFYIYRDKNVKSRDS